MESFYALDRSTQSLIVAAGAMIIISIFRYIMSKRRK